MKLLSEFFPIILFFIVYKFYGIYWATGIAIIFSLIQTLYLRIKNKQWDKLQLVTLLLIVFLGGATLLSHNELFIKWKPTAINWCFALIFLGSQFLGQKPLIQRLMEKNINLPLLVWQRLNLSWIAFFGLTGAINLYVAYNFSTNIWVNFKLFGILGLTIVFVIIQAIYLTKHLKDQSS